MRLPADALDECVVYKHTGSLFSLSKCNLIKHLHREKSRSRNSDIFLSSHNKSFSQSYIQIQGSKDCWKWKLYVITKQSVTRDHGWGHYAGRLPNDRDSL